MYLYLIHGLAVKGNVKVRWRMSGMRPRVIVSGDKEHFTVIGSIGRSVNLKQQLAKKLLRPSSPPIVNLSSLTLLHQHPINTDTHQHLNNAFHHSPFDDRFGAGRHFERFPRATGGSRGCQGRQSKGLRPHGIDLPSQLQISQSGLLFLPICSQKGA